MGGVTWYIKVYVVDDNCVHTRQNTNEFVAHIRIQTFRHTSLPYAAFNTRSGVGSLSLRLLNSFIFQQNRVCVTCTALIGSIKNNFTQHALLLWVQQDTLVSLNPWNDSMQMSPVLKRVKV